MDPVLQGLVIGIPIGTILGIAAHKLFMSTPKPQMDGVLQAQFFEAKEKLAAVELEIRGYAAQTAKLDSEKQALGEKLQEQQQHAQQLQQQMQLQFENLANKIFTEKNAESKKNLQELLSPLKEDLGGFKQHISEKFGEHAREQFALKREIESIVKVSSEMKFQTENLSKALKGDSKVQGNWGEMILERILEASGLRKGENYIVQGTGMGLKHPEDGRAQKPDVVVLLPEGKHVIVDAKVSLTAYERYCSEEETTALEMHLTQFLQSVKAHVKSLEDRRYQDTQGLNAPDYVMMFIPIEGAYALAMQQDAELHAYAWERRIIIVCPSTLFAILKIINSMWKLENQNKNAEEIAKRGGMLYDKIAGFVDDMSTIGKALDKAQEVYDGAFSKLSRGAGNVLRQAEMLKDLGVKASKHIKHASDDELPKLTKEDAA